MRLLPVILSGGSGTRLWPMSRAALPKQFLTLTSEQTMFQETVNRLHGINGLEKPLIVCNEEHRFLVAEQLRQIGQEPEAILLEPFGRNTAPAVALAALQAVHKHQDAILLVLPADHAIADRQAFHAAVATACQAAEQGALVTFGITPTEAHTGYGYIKRGLPTEIKAVACVERFVEKPQLEVAREFVASGEYLWNSGMFVFRASQYLSELERLRPDMLSACRAALNKAQHDLDFTRLDKAAFEACPSDSIDYAVMEHTAFASVVDGDFGWSDVGSWTALWDIGSKDAQGNVCHGDVFADGVNNSYIRAENRMVAVLGLSDVVVVETADAVMIAHKDKVQDVKNIVARLNQSGRSEGVFHRRVYRPWGSYEGVDAGGRFQVKRISVKPGAKLSLQMHHHRAEHWIVVSGTAKVVCDDRELLLTENQSTYIPLGSVHRLENPGIMPLDIIEVQSGPYLGEDDIVRFQDDYKRS